MRIGIVGAGKIGRALTFKLLELAHDVAVANLRDANSLASLARETGATATSVDQVTRDRDLVIVAVPMVAVADLGAAKFADVPIVVDTSNYYPRERDGRIADIENGMPESRWVEQQLGRPVIKTFNSIIAEHIRDEGLPAGAPGRIALSVAGDQPQTKAVVMALVDALGFDPLDAGNIAESWRFQPDTPVYLKDFPTDGVRQALAKASPKRTEKFTATPHSPGTYDVPA